MYRITAFLLFLITAQANNYVLPASIIGCYHPESGRTCTLPDRPAINTIEPSNHAHQTPNNLSKTELNFLYAMFMGFLIVSSVIVSMDGKKSLQPVYHVNENNIYFQPLPPIPEEDEQGVEVVDMMYEEGEENPVIFHYVNPVTVDTCGDPCEEA
jgi:hypothetical protein